MIEPRDDSSDHYFSAAPQAESRPREITIHARGLTLSVQTDRGVFSHGGLDRGTKLLAETMALREGASVLDWGAGYGPLGLIAATVCPTCRVTMVEINERAASLAAKNAERLRLPNVEVISGEAPGVLGDRRFDLIISNPPFRAGKAAVNVIIADAVERLAPGGELWLVVPTNKGAKGFFQTMSRLFSEAKTKAISGGYRILWARKS